jgi:hypothetical protein
LGEPAALPGCLLTDAQLVGEVAARFVPWLRVDFCGPFMATANDKTGWAT